MEAIVLRGVTKRFKKSTIRREHSTIKSELVRWLSRKRKDDGTGFIEVLRGIDLTVPKGKTLGIIGRNGSGKSTLLKLITKIYSPTSGTIEVQGRVSALLDLGAGFHPDFSGRENIIINGIILGMSRNEIKARMQDIIDFSELGDFVDEPVRTYSSGMFMRLAFAVATHVEPEILVIDEILAVGDEHFAHKSLAKMNEFKQQRRTIVLVTHDLVTVQRWCDLAAWIDAGQIRSIGPPHVIVDQYRRAVALAESQGTVLLPPAMEQRGHGQLPSVDEMAQPSQGPPADGIKRFGNFKVEIQDVQLSEPRQGVTAVFDPEDPMDVAISFIRHNIAEDIGVSVAFVRSDGALVYATNTFIEGVSFPSPLPETGKIVLQLKRIGFLEGSYVCNVAVQSRNGIIYDTHQGMHTFGVQSQLKDSGATRPPHQWIF